MVVTVGLTETELGPLTGKVPIPLMNTLVAFVVVHASVDDPPLVVIVDGVAVKLTTVGAGAATFTVTVIVAVVLPPSPVAVSV